MKIACQAWGVWAVGAMVVVALVNGCTRRPKSPVVARVGDAVLTVDDIYRSIPPEYRNRITREQNVNYVKQWIDTELLYQEALKRKIHKEKAIRERLARMERDLLSAEMLSRAQKAAAELTISDTVIQQYYQQYRETFVRPKDVVRFLDLTVSTMPRAQSLRALLTPANFFEIAAQQSTQPVGDALTAPFVPVDELPPQLQAPLRAARPGAIVGPVAVDSTYHLLYVLERQDAGSVATLEEVRELIADRLASHIRRREVERLIESLRLKTNVSYDFNLIPGVQAETTNGGEISP